MHGDRLQDRFRVREELTTVHVTTSQNYDVTVVTPMGKSTVSQQQALVAECYYKLADTAQDQDLARDHDLELNL